MPGGFTRFEARIFQNGLFLRYEMKKQPEGCGIQGIFLKMFPGKMGAGTGDNGAFQEKEKGRFQDKINFRNVPLVAVNSLLMANYT
jgi:hypothetical protein